MGGGSVEPVGRDILLVTLALPASQLKSHINTLQSHYPQYKVTFHSTLPDSPPPSPEIYKSTTVLLTNSILPPTHTPPSTAYPHLRLVHFFSAGVPPSLFSHPLWEDTDIICTTSSGVAAPQIAECVVLGELTQRRKYDELRARQRKHEWGADRLDMMDVPDGVGKTVGVLGYGGIGRQVGRVLGGFGWKVVAYTASARDTPEKRRETDKYTVPGTGDVEGSVPVAWYSGTGAGDVRGFLEAEKEGGLDWLVVCVPLTKGTEGLVGKEEFEVLGDEERGKRGRCFVTNVSRGQVLDQGALVEALRPLENGLESGHAVEQGDAVEETTRSKTARTSLLRGAALDVTDPEPLPKDSPLWDMENVVITPHIAGLGKGYAGRSFDVLEQNLDRLHKGDELLNVVSRRKGY